MARTHSTNPILYEPRVLWGQVRIRPDSAAPVQVQFPSTAFYNGGRWPMVFSHVLISPLGYTFQRYNVDPTLSAVTYRNAMAAALSARVRLTLPGRKHISRSFVPSGGYRPLPTGIAKPDSDYASSLLGISSWDFDFPDAEGMVLPRLNQVEFNLSGYNLPNAGLSVAEARSLVKAHAIFTERRDDFWGRTARYSGSLPIQPKVLLSGQPDDIYPATPPPVYPDGFGFAASPFNLRPEDNLTFDRFGVWNAKRWATEEANVGTDADRFCGFSVLLDQIGLDDAMQDSATPGVVGQPLAPLSQRVAVDARTRAGGTGEDWFYPVGAPLSLCCPTINESAVVHKFDDPISLEVNAGLRVEIEVPGGLVQDAEVFSGIYNLGVSLVGYAIIPW